MQNYNIFSVCISSRSVTTITAQSLKVIVICFFQFDYILLDRSSIKINPNNSQLLRSDSSANHQSSSKKTSIPSLKQLLSWAKNYLYVRRSVLPALWQQRLWLGEYTNKGCHLCAHCKTSACDAHDCTQCLQQPHGTQSHHPESKRDCSDSRTHGSWWEERKTERKMLFYGPGRKLREAVRANKLCL